LGLLFAYYLDFSIGPAIGLFLGGKLIIVAIIGKFRRSQFPYTPSGSD